MCAHYNVVLHASKKKKTYECNYTLEFKLEYSCYGASPLLHSIVVSAETLLRNGMVFIDITLSSRMQRNLGHSAT